MLNDSLTTALLDSLLRAQIANDPASGASISQYLLSIGVVGVLIPIGLAVRKLIVAKVDSMTTSITEQETMRYRTELSNQMSGITALIQEMMAEIRASRHPGHLHAMADVVRISHKHWDAVNCSITQFFLHRLIENHIETDHDEISVNYSQFANDLAGRMRGYLNHWTYNGRNLGDFFVDDGAVQYCRYICTELLSIQANGNVNIHQVKAGLARCTSELMSQFKVYLTDGRSFMEQWDDRKPKFVILQKLNPVEPL